MRHCSRRGYLPVDEDCGYAQGKCDRASVLRPRAPETREYVSCDVISLHLELQDEWRRVSLTRETLDETI